MLWAVEAFQRNGVDPIRADQFAEVKGEFLQRNGCVIRKFSVVITMDQYYVFFLSKTRQPVLSLYEIRKSISSVVLMKKLFV